MESSKTRRYVSEGTMIRVFLKLLYQDGMLDNDTYVIAQKLVKEMYPVHGQTTARSSEADSS